MLSALCVSVVSLLSACRPDPQARQVVLYTSCDDYLLREVIPLFEKESGIKVLIVGDTEATKTTGLVQRLLDEKERGSIRADVWWSNESLGTAKLDEAGALEPYTSPVEKGFAKGGESGGWPWPLRPKNGAWYGFGLRNRALVYNTKRLSKDEVPTDLARLARPEWKGRLGMARPQFGTTRAHMAWYLANQGEESYRAVLQGLKANGVRLYDGNSTVVRAVANGEIDIGLTDTDDVYAGQRQGWPVGLAFEATPTDGPLLIPNTVALVRGGPHRANGAALIDFFLSERVERILVRSDAHLGPVRPAVQKEYPEFIGRTPKTDIHESELLKAAPRAMQIWDEVFGR